MNKQALRDRVWDALEESGEARFPFPPHGRIPNFAGAAEAADRLAEQEEWRDADTLKTNPDAPQLPVRRRALREGKTLYMAQPRLKSEKPFLRLDPAAVTDVDEATTVSGVSKHAVPVGPEAVEPIELIIAGSVAVTEDGARIGKGEGYSDLEFAVLREFDLVDEETTVATTVHGMQVVSERVETDDHDVPMDLIATPERSLRPAPGSKPAGLLWNRLDEERIAEIPVLSRVRR
ncbi:5-formyltetrahydrofolate cyclo-ligase [Natronorarus salvus]|uniref:5-formyltetrahydrofolate cyclo-ligase n=1 Tax=Natronorarus salvus TaxID=3117733 RepID=UPI002F267007